MKDPCPATLRHRNTLGSDPDLTLQIDPSVIQMLGVDEMPSAELQRTQHRVKRPVPDPVADACANRSRAAIISGKARRRFDKSLPKRRHHMVARGVYASIMDTSVECVEGNGWDKAATKLQWLAAIIRPNFSLVKKIYGGFWRDRRIGAAKAGSNPLRELLWMKVGMKDLRERARSTRKSTARRRLWSWRFRTLNSGAALKGQSGSLCRR